MRLFVAIPLSVSIRRALSGIRATLEPLADRTAWVAPENLHITLRFLGEVVPSRVQSIDDALRTVEHPPFQVAITGLGMFPTPRSGRVCWAGVKSDQIGRLASGVDEVLDRVGFPRDHHPFRPHVTLGRTRGRTFPPRLIEHVTQRGATDVGTMLVEHYTLFESRLTPHGAVHTALRQYPLNGGARRSRTRGDHVQRNGPRQSCP